MDSISILDELLGLMAGQGITMRKGPMGGDGGGLCKLRGSTTFFVDTQADTMEMAVKAAKALVSMVDMEKIFIKPQLRQFIDQYSADKA
ncbi:MAG: hypothetical protein A2Y07_00840 [Planctomycetes bacterium GWF2_50_10]|nr:MAG: hypothetical protein A2Y07_00840 [Planctomycetes bacterium GWF2_50_10]